MEGSGHGGSTYAPLSSLGAAAVIGHNWPSAELLARSSNRLRESRSGTAENPKVAMDSTSSLPGISRKTFVFVENVHIISL